MHWVERVMEGSDMVAGMETIGQLMKNRKGATAIEYGLIAALIAVAAIAAMQGLGNKLKTTFNNVSSNMTAS